MCLEDGRASKAPRDPSSLIWKDTRMTDVCTRLEGLVVGESPRWHADRLWLSNWGAGEIIALDDDGRMEVVAQAPSGVPFCFDWLPDSDLLIVSGPEARLVRQRSDGSQATYRSEER